jgi:hypothetical protein
MKKIPTIFVRDLNARPALVVPTWVDGCEWVRDGEGLATRKWDGSSVMIREGKRFKRRELRPGDICPPGFELLEVDPVTKNAVGWVPVGDGPDDRWHREAPEPGSDGTFELVGPKVNGNRDGFLSHLLLVHGGMTYQDAPRDFEGLRAWLSTHQIEGLVWHHADGRMAKIKRRDFGLKW